MLQYLLLLGNLKMIMEKIYGKNNDEERSLEKFLEQDSKKTR